jgi:hypothetical protein
MLRFGLARSRVARLGYGALMVTGLLSVATPAAMGAANQAAAIPKPAGMTVSVDPSCKAHPTAAYCTQSVRYTAVLSTVAARGKWAPTLKSWGLKTASDTCVSRPVTAGTSCVLSGTKGKQHVTLLFKAIYSGQYSPPAVAAQTTAVQVKANQEVKKAKTAAAKATIVKAAQTKIASIKRTAAAWNAAHPNVTVTVNVR